MKRIISAVVSGVVVFSILQSTVFASTGVSGRYKDVEGTAWYAEAVNRLSTLDIVNGMTDGSFNPQGEVTRAQFVKMLVQAMEYKKIDSVSFLDMKANAQAKAHWASVYIETALRSGVIIKAEEGDRFYPDVPIKRDDMVMMICRALKLDPSDGESPYFDLSEPNGYFTKTYEEYLVRGIPVGNKVIFNGTGVTTRAQAAEITARLIDYKADPEGFVARAAMEERFKNGTQTSEDVAAMRKQELAKAQADPNYIMEPIITVGIDEKYKEYRWFELYFDNKEDYSNDCKWTLEVTNYRQLNNYEMPRPDGTFVKETITGWRPLGSKYKDKPRTPSLILGKNYYTTQDLIKSFKLSEGMDIKFKIILKKGNEEKVVYKTVTLQ